MAEAFHHRDRCAIAGIGATDFSRDSGRSDLTLATQAALAALADAGLTPRDIDGIVRCDRTVRHNDLVHALGLTRLDYFSEVGPGGRRAVRHGRPGGRRDPVRSGHDRARVPLAQRALGPALRPQPASTRAAVGGGGTYDEFFLPYGLLTPGPDLRPAGPAPHARVRHEREGPRPHRAGLPGPGQRQPLRPDARPPADDGRLPRPPG